MTWGIRAGLVGCLAVVLTAGCGEINPELLDGPREIPLEPVDLPPEQLSPTPAGITIELLDPGAEPRQLLRYRLPPGHTERVRIVTSDHLEIGLRGRGKTTEEDRTVALVVDATVEGGAGQGRIRWSFEIVEATAERVASGRLRRSDVEVVLDALRGKTGFAITTDRGLPDTLSIRLPRMPDRSSQTLAHSLTRDLHMGPTPLPLEPVGLGARWKYSDSVEVRGVRLERESILELVTLEGNRGSCTATTVVTSPGPQLYSYPRLPADAEVGLDSWEGTGSGRGDFDLERVFDGPATAESRAEHTFHGSIEGVMREDWVGSSYATREQTPVELPAPAVE
jgi:hypothetical protein